MLCLFMQIAMDTSVPRKKWHQLSCDRLNEEEKDVQGKHMPGINWLPAYVSKKRERKVLVLRRNMTRYEFFFSG